MSLYGDQQLYGCGHANVAAYGCTGSGVTNVHIHHEYGWPDDCAHADAYCGNHTRGELIIAMGGSATRSITRGTTHTNIYNIRTKHVTSTCIPNTPHAHTRTHTDTNIAQWRLPATLITSPRADERPATGACARRRPTSARVAYWTVVTRMK